MGLPAEEYVIFDIQPKEVKGLKAFQGGIDWDAMFNTTLEYYIAALRRKRRS